MRNKKHRDVSKTHEIKREVLFESTDEQRVLDKEVFYVDMLHTYVADELADHLACNMTVGWEGVVGHVFSDETRKKMSESHKGKKLSQETKDKVSVSNKKRYEDPKKREAVGENNRKRKGKYHRSEESKRKISATTKGVPRKSPSEETRKKISASKKGKSHAPHSTETKEKISKSRTYEQRSETAKKSCERRRNKIAKKESE